MPCERFAGTILCRNRVYRYKGYYFDVHSYCGPTRLKKDDSPHMRPGQKFWDMYVEFEKLSDEEKQKYEV